MPQRSTAQGNADLEVVDIIDPHLRNKCKQVLRTVPIYTARECYEMLMGTNGNVEKAVLYLSDPKRMAARTSQQVESALRSNVMVEPQIKMDTMRLQRNSLATSVQSCYIALRISEGNYEGAAKHLELGRR